MHSTKIKTAIGSEFCFPCLKTNQQSAIAKKVLQSAFLAREISPTFHLEKSRQGMVIIFPKTTVFNIDEQTDFSRCCFTKFPNIDFSAFKSYLQGQINQQLPGLTVDVLPVKSTIPCTNIPWCFTQSGRLMEEQTKLASQEMEIRIFIPNQSEIEANDKRRASECHSPENINQLIRQVAIASFSSDNNQSIFPATSNPNCSSAFILKNILDLFCFCRKSCSAIVALADNCCPRFFIDCCSTLPFGFNGVDDVVPNKINNPFFSTASRAIMANSVKDTLCCVLPCTCFCFYAFLTCAQCRFDLLCNCSILNEPGLVECFIVNCMGYCLLCHSQCSDKNLFNQDQQQATYAQHWEWFSPYTKFAKNHVPPQQTMTDGRELPEMSVNVTETTTHDESPESSTRMTIN